MVGATIGYQKKPKKVHELLGGAFLSKDFIRVYRYWERYDMAKSTIKAGSV
jgi:hypothetical protein